MKELGASEESFLRNQRERVVPVTETPKPVTPGVTTGFMELGGRNLAAWETGSRRLISQVRPPLPKSRMCRRRLKMDMKRQFLEASQGYLLVRFAASDERRYRWLV